MASRGKGIIVGRTHPASQLCPRCGRLRAHHREGVWKCPVPREVTDALYEFKVANGARWRSKLKLLWESGKESELLRQARNLIGPTSLHKINPTRLSGYSKPQ
jgi:ribosomal protein L37AE/L43A